MLSRVRPLRRRAASMAAKSAHSFADGLGPMPPNSHIYGPNYAHDGNRSILFGGEKLDLKVFNENHMGVKTIYINRPKALHALDLDMVRELKVKVEQFDDHNNCSAIFIRSPGEKAFCAGGDVKWLWENGKKPEMRDDVLDFFACEYFTNHTLATSQKQFVSLMDGITMGGGVGISAHCRFVACTENTVFAMPECSIGLFPDVGSSFLLPRLPDGMGMYLGLTGAQLKANQLLYAGIATHYIASTLHEDMAMALGINALRGGDDNVMRALCGLTDAMIFDEGRFALDDMYWIRWVFGTLDGERSAADCSLPAILDRLRSLATADARTEPDAGKRRCYAWAAKSLRAIESASPISVRVTHEQLTRGAGLSVEDAFRQEFRLVQRFMDGHDFYEGVRAMLVDRDRKPKWEHASVADVPDDLVTSYFEPRAGDKQLTLLPDRTLRPRALDLRNVQEQRFRPITTEEYLYFARLTWDPYLPVMPEPLSVRHHSIPETVNHKLGILDVQDEMDQRAEAEENPDIGDLIEFEDYQETEHSVKDLFASAAEDPNVDIYW